MVVALLLACYVSQARLIRGGCTAGKREFDEFFMRVDLKNRQRGFLKDRLSFKARIYNGEPDIVGYRFLLYEPFDTSDCSNAASSTLTTEIMVFVGASDGNFAMTYHWYRWDTEFKLYGENSRVGYVVVAADIVDDEWTPLYCCAIE